MFRLSLLFFILALASILIVASNNASFSFELGQIVITVFLVLAVISFLISLLASPKPSISYH